MIPPHALTPRDRALLKIALPVTSAALIGTLGAVTGGVLSGFMLLAAVAMLKGSRPDAPPRRRPPGHGPPGGAPVPAPLLPRPVLSGAAAKSFPPLED